MKDIEASINHCDEVYLESTIYTLMRAVITICILFLLSSVRGQSLSEQIDYAVNLKRNGDKKGSTAALLELIPVAQNQDNDSLTALLYTHLHWNFAYNTDRDSTLKYFNLADSLVAFLPYDEMYMLYIHMGDYYQYIEDYEQAQKYFVMVDSISLAKNHNNSTSALRLGELYFALLDCETAIGYFQKGIEYARAEKVKFRIILGIQGILNCAGDDWHDPPYRKYFNEAAEYILSNDDIRLDLKHAELYYGISMDQMITYLKERIENNTSLYYDPDNSTHGILMNALYEQKEYKEVLHYFRLKQSLKDTSSTSRDLGSLQIAMKSYENLGKLDSAYYYSKVLFNLQEEYFNQSNKQTIDSLNVKYNYSVKEKEALEKTTALIEVKRNRNIWILSLCLLGLGGAFYYFNHNKWKNRLHSSQLEKKDKANKVSSLMSMIKGQEKERERIAKDLHDSLGSILSLAKAQVSASNDPAEASDLIDRASSEVRRISHNMMPSALEENDLISAIEDLVNSIHTKTDVKTSFNTNVNILNLTKVDSMIMYRIVEELCNNVLKHSNAKNLFVDILKSDGQVTLNVEDDGVGMSGDVQEGFGLKSIRSRLEILDGEMDVASYEGKGTSITINILQASNDEG